MDRNGLVSYQVLTRCTKAVKKNAIRSQSKSEKRFQYAAQNAEIARWYNQGETELYRIESLDLSTCSEICGDIFLGDALIRENSRELLRQCRLSS